MEDEKLDPTFNDKLYEWLRGNDAAYSLAQGLMFVAHLWDDLIDKDKMRTDSEINSAFQFILSEMPLNPFYQQHVSLLAPQISNVAIQYHLANILERGTDGEKHTAFAMRNSLINVVAYLIYIVGGSDWYSTAGLGFYQYISKNMDSLFNEFMVEMQSCQIQLPE